MRLRTKDGFTLVEVLIAVTILSIGILGIAGLAGTAIKNSGYSQAVSSANNLAQERIEALLAVPYANIQVTDTVTARTDLRRTCVQTDATASKPVFSCTPSTVTIPIGNRNFDWSYTVTFIDLSGDGVAHATLDGLKEVSVTVSWADQLFRATKSITLVTMRARS
ncbi:MAG: hypothetical protein A2054_07270 [Deltaproteobacteria bacterium GWA2_55_10]|nr:MAG: hypothetical protein A2054_07270 [Deltaproteobacteria bacterium GWA2_55_10]